MPLLAVRHPADAPEFAVSANVIVHVQLPEEYGQLAPGAETSPGAPTEEGEATSVAWEEFAWLIPPITKAAAATRATQATELLWRA